MKASTLETLTPLLNALRGYATLKENRRAVFYLDGRDFIHFHDDEELGLVADVLLAKGRIRMPVATKAEQAELLERIESKLISLVFHGAKGQKRKGNKRER